MSKEWGKDNQYDGLFTALCMSVFGLIVGVLLAGCTAQWPDIGGGVRVKEIKIRSCNQLEDECGTKV